MIKIRLVNPPFASIRRPAIGLTQIKSRLDTVLPRRTDTDVVYLNLDFADYLGLDAYSAVAESVDHHVTGLGDWLFRQVAFPGLPDNADAFFQRFYPQYSNGPVRTSTSKHAIDPAHLKSVVHEKRPGLQEILTRLIDDYALDQADIVGFSSTFAQNVASIALARLLKARRPEVIVAIGGANCESTMGKELVRRVDAIDFVFSGPALVSFPRFVECHLNGDPEKIQSIPGVLSRTSQARSALRMLGQTPIAPIGEELDINTRIELDYTQYLHKLADTYARAPVNGTPRQRPSLLFETSRGCWWGEKAHCTFCGLNGETMAYRSMASDHAVTLIESLFRYADSCECFESVDNILPQHYVEQVFNRISSPPGTHIFYEVKADLSRDDLETLSKAGVRRVQPGIESLATSTLRLMKKGTTASQNVQFLRNCVATDVKPMWNLLVGFPGEQEEVYRKYCADLPLLTHLPPPSGAFPVRFDRFSPYFNKAGEYQLDLHPMDYYQFVYPFDANGLANIAYYFSDHHFEADYALVMVKWLSKVREKVKAWRTLWSDDGPDRRARPRLEFAAETGGAILDSRSGAMVRHDVGPCGRRLLESLSKAKSASMIGRDLPDLDVSRDMQTLCEKGLIFVDGDRWVSLVCQPAGAV